MAVWIVIPGGRITRFRNRPTLHSCRRKRHGRPAVGLGLCYNRNVARHIRRVANGRLARAIREGSEPDFTDVDMAIVRTGVYR